MIRTAPLALALLLAVPAALACQTVDTRFTEPPGAGHPRIPGALCQGTAGPRIRQGRRLHRPL